MAFTLNKVHEFAVVAGQSQPQVIARHYYIRLKGEGADYPLYIQEGQVWAEGGDLIPPDELPDWFWVELGKCSPAALEAAQWQGDEAPSPLRRR